MQMNAAASEPDRPPRVLMLTHRLPYPPDRGDRIRSYHLLRTLNRHADVAIACTSDEPVWLQHHQLLATMAGRVAIYPVSSGWSRLRGLAAQVRGRAATPACFYRYGLAEQIRQWHEQTPFDAILTFCTGMIGYARALTGTAHAGARPFHVLDLVDVDSLKWQAYARQTRPPVGWVYGIEARRLRRIEAGLEDRIDAVTVTTEAEAQTYREHVGGAVPLVAVSNGVDVGYFHPLPDSAAPQIVFVGVLNYKPNVDGIVWFCDHVMPALRRREPHARVAIVGRHPTQRVIGLGDRPGIEVVGSVPDVRDHLARAAVAIAPLQIARGVQNKVLEAMASARAVVCSPGAAAGIDAIEGEHMLVADTPDRWVEHLLSVLGDRALRTRLAGAARARVEQRYDWDRCLEPMVELIRKGTSAAAAPPRAKAS